SRAYLSLGSNIGDKKNNLDEAVKLIKSNSYISDVLVSEYYETAPVGYLDQDVFMNIVVQINTTLDSYKLLDFCHEIEEALKRKRIIRWGPRTIDVDILLFDDIISDDERLTIPHPRMTERAFVIVPLYDLSQELVINNLAIKDIFYSLNKDDIRKMPHE
ncbi:MAG: 2-amino-4-hydroxy-6-hydroxymethyldihydropteridine diphosphokinase, partial [Acidaminobacteraceae bacterium]